MLKSTHVDGEVTNTPSSTMVQQITSIASEGFELEDKHKFQPFDVVYESPGNPDGYVALGVILAGPMLIPYFEDGCASGYATKPLDFKNPDEWELGYWAYVVYDLGRQKETLSAASMLSKLEEHVTSGYIPFDQGTAQLRVPLGLIQYAERLYGKRSPGLLESIMTLL